MKRLKVLGIALAVIGLIFIAGGGVALSMTSDGYQSLNAFSEAQDVALSYNDQGQLTDRGTTEGADAIMSELTDEWGYTVNEGDFDPNDPIINTAGEFMYQMATINYHVRNGTQTVVLAEDKEYDGETFAAGTYEFPVDGRYWEGFDRKHPIEGPARAQAWTGTVFGLTAQLGVGTVTASVLQLATALSFLIFGIGATTLFGGLGLVWVAKGNE